MTQPLAIPRWRFTILLALMSMLGPFSIDTYVPAFRAMETDLQTTGVAILQTLTVYFFAFAVMTLWHGAISDSVGRRPVILFSLAIYIVASVACAFSPNISLLIAARIAQGLVAGVGNVVGRAIIRDAFIGPEAQRMQAQVTIVFGAAPALAPIIGGYLLVHAGWRSIFVFMAVIAAIAWWGVFHYLPETLPKDKRHPLKASVLLSNYRKVFATGRFQFLSASTAFLFSGLFIYIGSASDFVLTHLKLSETQFAWLFMPFIFGMMTAAYVTTHIAGRFNVDKQMRTGLTISLLAAITMLLLALTHTLQIPWGTLPLYVYGIGMGTFMSAGTLRLLDFFPTLRGTTSSLMSFAQTMLAALVTGIVAPVVSKSLFALVATALIFAVIAALAWSVYMRRYRHVPPLH